MAARLASTGHSLGALILCVALLPLFLHAAYQPSVDVGSVTLRLADLAVLAVAAAALLEGRRVGFARLRAGRWIWLAGALFFAVVAISMLAAAASDRAYPLGAHTVTAGKYAEYALIALAVPLLVRTRADLRLLLLTVTGLAVLATAGGVLQFVGVPLFQEGPAGRRQASFLGHHDFAALAGAALVLGFVTTGRLAVVGWIAGAVGLVVSGAVTGAAGLVLAAAIAVVVTRRRAALVAVTLVLVIAGILAIRSSNIAEQFDDTTGAVETFSHRGVLAYIGVKEFAAHPATGIGWQASLDEAGYGPYLDDAKRRYPDQPDRVFPSPDEPWGIQNAYLQSLAEMGILGGIAIVALLASGVLTGLRTALRAGSPTATAALVGTLWLCIVAGIWNGIGLIAGLPLDALLWLALGLTATAAAGLEESGDG